MMYASALQRFGINNRGRVRENRKTRPGKPRPARQVWWYVGAALVAAAFGGGSEAVWSAMKRYAARHPYFAIEEIQVSSDGRFPADQVRAWSGLAPGMSLWEIHPERVEARLRAQPWVRTAVVRREFPRRVLVAVQTRRPVAIILRRPFTYLDDAGAYFVPREGGGEVDLPYVSGLEHVPLDTPEARAVLATVVHLLSLARLWREPLSEIRWDQRRGYTAFLAGRQVTISLGEEPAPEQFARVRAVLETWPADWPATSFDARFARQVIVRPDLRGPSRTQTPDPTRRPL
ncbi:MAG: FtsQ-type POTRA domain-containing protein [Thermodesulfobacteriota bacterium]